MLFWNISSRLISFMDSLTGDLQSLNLLHLVLQCNGNQLNLCQACYFWVHLCTIPDVFGMHKVLHCLQSPSGVPKPSCHWHQLASFDLATCNPSIAVVDSDLSLFSIFKFSVVFLPDVCIFLTIASWIKDPSLAALVQHSICQYIIHIIHRDNTHVYYLGLALLYSGEGPQSYWWQTHCSLDHLEHYFSFLAHNHAWLLDDTTAGSTVLIFDHKSWLFQKAVLSDLEWKNFFISQPWWVVFKISFVQLFSWKKPHESS